MVGDPVLLSSLSFRHQADVLVFQPWFVHLCVVVWLPLLACYIGHRQT